MKQILASNAKHPTALFAGNDTIAFGAMLAIREAGLSIPEDFAVVGYDDLPLAAYAAPPYHHPHACLRIREAPGRGCNEANHQGQNGSQQMCPLELVIRDSCGAKREETQSGSRSMSSKQRMNARASKERLKAMRSAVEF